MRALVVVLLVVVGCVSSEVVECEDGYACPSTKVCDNVNHTCVDASQLADCAGMADGTDCLLRADQSAGLCRGQVCLVAECGDGFRRGDELCDGEDFGPTPALCTDLEYYEPTPLACNLACGYDESVCATAGYCGDLIRNGGELCDGSPPPRSCVDVGYGAGFLDCHMCGPGLDDCRFFGWRSVYSAPTNYLSIHGTSDNDIWVSGAGTTLMRFSGDRWMPVDLSSCVTTSETIKLNGVWTFGGGNAIAVGYDSVNQRGVAIRIMPTGCTKTILAPGISQDTDYDVWASGPSDIYVVGRAIHHFDGANWSTSNTNTVLRTIWGRNANDIYAGGVGTLLRYNGAAWSPVTLPTLIDEVWAIGGTATKVYVSTQLAAVHEIWSHDGTWTQSRTSAGPVHGFANDGERVYAAEFGIVLANEGSAWLDLQSNLGASWDLWATPTGKLAAASFTFEIGIYEGTVWARDASPLTQGSSVTAQRADRAAAVMGLTNAKKVHLWNGKTWAQDNGNIGEAKQVWMDPATGTLLALDPSGLWRRPVGGPWTASAEVSFTPASARFAARTPTDIWLFDDTGAVRHWDGVQLTCVSCTTTANLRAMWGSAANDWYGVASGGGIVHWNGSAWSTMTSPTTADLTSIWGSGPTDIYAVGNLGTIVHFDGAAWSKVLLPIAAPLLAVTGTAANDVFVAGFSGVMYHFDGAYWSPVRTEQTVPFTGLAIGGSVLFTTNSGVDRPFRLVRSNPW